MIKEDAKDYIREWCPYDKQDEIIKALEQESVLDKIRAEIENDWQLKKYPSSPFSCGLRRAIEIIDKYRKSENNERSYNF